MKAVPGPSETANHGESAPPVRRSERRNQGALLFLALFLALAPAALANNTWYVDGVNGNDNNNCMSPQTACKTIGHAISLASKGDSVMVAPATYTENLTISISLKVIGAGASTTIIDGGQVNTVVTISSAKAHVFLSNLSIQNGVAQGNGGGINNDGTLTVSHSTLIGNGASNCGSQCGGSGGGINNNSTLTVNYSSLIGNYAETGCCDQLSAGGGINNNGTLTVNNSTISSNSAPYGGGIANAGTVAIINNSTIVGNGATGGGIDAFNGGTTLISNSTFSGNTGNVMNYDATVAIQNSILANAEGGGNCSGFMVTSDGYNISDDNTCNFNGPGDLNNTNPKLKALGNYGGPTQTMALPAGSPAIDAGNPKGCTGGNGHLLKTDQRGYPRPGPHDHHGCDMGAFENQKH